MDEIKVREYVRINKSSRFLGIGKVKRIVGDTIYLKTYVNLPMSFTLEEIKKYKHSKNKTDLIEVGDYVNGDLVYKITENLIYVRGKSVIRKHTNIIKDIVTKEQFENMKYNFEEE